MEPFVEQEEGEQEAAAGHQEGEQERIEPVQPLALQGGGRQHAQRNDPGDDADEIELPETIQAQRVFGQAIS